MAESGESRRSRQVEVRHASSEQAPDSEVRRDSNVGRVINARYRILSRLASGGMAVVYLAEQVPLGRLCAIKRLRKGLNRESGTNCRKRFFLEASVASRLSSPNSIRVYDFGTDDDGQPYIAMEYVDGKTIHEVLTGEGLFSQRRMLRVAYQICRSIREAHKKGFTHRDLKPSNVMLMTLQDQPDFVKVLDFGLVSVLGDGKGGRNSQPGMLIGSPQHMSPEQIEGDRVDGRADIYALGLMMFEMLTGCNPMARNNVGATLLAHLDDPPPQPIALRSDLKVDPVVEAVMMRCLAKRPDDRYESVSRLMEAIRRAARAVGDCGLRTTSDESSHSAPAALAFSVVTRREQDPTDAAPVSYREYAYEIRPGASEQEARRFIRERFEEVRNSLSSAPPGKLVNLAVFDHTFVRRPERAPLATLVWKDWRGEPEIRFPCR
jgi:eukaryotic-like serine/threonine-protein kinase